MPWPIQYVLIMLSIHSLGCNYFFSNLFVNILIDHAVGTAKQSIKHQRNCTDD